MSKHHKRQLAEDHLPISSIPDLRVCAYRVHDDSGEVLGHVQLEMDGTWTAHHKLAGRIQANFRSEYYAANCVVGYRLPEPSASQS